MSGAYLLVNTKSGIFKGPSDHRKSAGWFELSEFGRMGGDQSRSSYYYTPPKLRVVMPSVQNSNGITGLTDNFHRTIPWVAIEQEWDKGCQWWTFFEVSMEGASYGGGTDDPKAPNGYTSLDFGFTSANRGDGRWTGAIPTPVPRTGYEPGQVVQRVTDNAVAYLPKAR